MTRVVVPALLAVLTAASVVVGTAADRPLRIFFIDVEGGQSTLVVTPEGESLLIDAGYGPRGPREPNRDVTRGPSRDPDRVMAAVREAGLGRIDYLLANAPAAERFVAAHIHRAGGLEVSDHAPVSIDLED